MQNYGGYYQQYQQGQNPMYPNPGGQNNNMNQSNMRNMFSGPQNYGMPQMQQGPPQQYGYQQQQQQMPQQNFVFHFDMNNAPSNMNMNMTPYATANPPQYGSSPYGGPQMQQNGNQKKEDKNDELFNAFDPFNPKPRTKPKPKPPQNAAPQQPPAPNPPQIQMIEDIQPKKQDLDAFRTAFASLAGPAQQPPQPPQQPQQQFGMQTGQIYGGNIQAPIAPQIEGFNFASGIQNTQQAQPTQMENFNFGTQQQQQPPQNNTFTNQASSQPINPSFSNQQQQAANNSASKNTHEDIFASFNPISPSQPKTSNQQQQQQPTDFSAGFSSNNQAQNQFGNSDAFSFGKQQAGSGGGFTPFSQQQTGSNGGMPSFNQQQTGSGGGFTPFSQQQIGSNGGMPSFNQQQTGSNGGMPSFNQQQTGSNGGVPSFNQQQTGSGGGFTPFSQQQAGSTGGIHSFNQQQTGSGGGFTPFSQQQAGSNGEMPSFNQQQTGSGGGFTPFSQQQAGSTGNPPINTIDDIFGSPSSSQQQQKPNEQPQASSTNPFLLNVSNTDSNPFVKSNKKETSNNSPLAPPQTNNNLQNQPQEIQNNGMFNPFGSAPNQQTPTATTGASSFGDSFRQAIGEPSPSPSAPQQPTTNETPKQTEGETSDFHNIFSQGQNFFGHQEQQQQQQQQQQQTAPEGFTFTSQNIGDSGAPNFSNFTFNTPGQSEQNANSQFGGTSFGNFGGNESNTAPQINQPAQEQPAAVPFTPFGVSDLQPMSNSTFIISGSGDSVSSQPTAIPAAPVDTEKIPYFVEQEKKMEFENRIKNDTMSVFDPFNPNPQPNQLQQPQQPQQSQQVQNAHKETEEQLNLSASINASVDTIRNIFGGPSDENENDNKEEEKQQENEQKAPEIQQQNEQSNDDNQNPFLGGFSAGFGSENKDTQNKTSDIQLNVGLGEDDKDKNENNNFENNPFANGNVEFQGYFGKSPEANSFGFGGFGFNNSFGNGNVFQHAFETGNMEKPATFNDFFPHHNSEPITPPIQVIQPKEEDKEEKEKEPPKSETPFAAGFDFLEFNQPKQSENQNKKENEKQEEEPNPFIFGKQQIDFNNPFGSPEPQQKQEEQKIQQKQEEPNEPTQQNQKEIDFDNPFIDQSNLTLFGQAPKPAQPAQPAQKNEPFNPFGNQSLETVPQTSSSMSFNSTADVFSSQTEIQKKDEPELKQKESTKKKETKDKGKDIFDEIPNDISEIDKSLPEKPPPFIMPTIGDNSTNPFTSVLSSTSTTSNPFATNNNNNENPFATNSSTPESNPFVSQPATESTKDENKNNKTETTNKEDEKEENKKSSGLDDLIGFDFGFTSSKPETNNTNNEKETTSNADNPFLANFNNDKNESTETKQTEKVEDKKETKEEKTEQDTSGFTFSSATSNNTNDANPFSKGFNPFGGDFSNAFASSTTTTTTTTTTNDNQSGGFTFTPTFDKEEESKESKEEEATTLTTTKEEEENKPKDEEEQKPTQEETKENNNDEKSPEKNEDQENNKNMNIVDTLDDDLFDFNSVENFQPVQHKGKNNDLFGEIHTFPVSNSTSDFLEMKQKKENKNNNVGQSVLMMSDGCVGSKSAASPLTEKSQTINTGFVSILTPYGNTTDDHQFSVSSDGEDPEVLKIMNDDNPMSKILKKYVKPPENDFYGPFEKDPHPIRIFPKFENTEAAKVLAEFVSNQFGITASFASTSKKQKEEIDMNSIFNVPAASEPNDDDDFLLII